METGNVANQEFIISEKKIIRFSIILIFVLFLFFLLPYIILWSWNSTFIGFKRLLKHLILWLLPIIVVHEGLHGLMWIVFNRNGFRNFSFGFNKDMLAPYTHFKIPMKKWVYITGGLAPLLFMGVLPAIVSFFYGNSYFYSLSLFCIWSAAGDILSCYYAIKIPAGFKIQDHPEQLGFILIST